MKEYCFGFQKSINKYLAEKSSLYNFILPHITLYDFMRRYMILYYKPIVSQMPGI